MFIYWPTIWILKGVAGCFFSAGKFFSSPNKCRIFFRKQEIFFRKYCLARNIFRSFGLYRIFCFFKNTHTLPLKRNGRTLTHTYVLIVWGVLYSTGSWRCALSFQYTVPVATFLVNKVFSFRIGLWVCYNKKNLSVTETRFIVWNGSRVFAFYIIHVKSNSVAAKDKNLLWEIFTYFHGCFLRNEKVMQYFHVDSPQFCAPDLETADEWSTVATVPNVSRHHVKNRCGTSGFV